MLLYRIERLTFTGPTDQWTTVTPLVAIPAEDRRGVVELADDLAVERRRDDPEYRASFWIEDIRISVYALPDGTHPAEADPETPPAATRLILGGLHLQATQWWTTTEAARKRYFIDAGNRNIHGLTRQLEAWKTSNIRASLLARRPDNIDGPHQDDLDSHFWAGTPLGLYQDAEDAIMRIPSDATGDAPIHRLADKITATSTTAATYDLPRSGGKHNLIATILAEFLVGAEFAPRSWFRPTQDQEPDPDVARVYDGKINYERIASGWQSLDSADCPIYTWQDIPAPLLVDSSRVSGGSWRLNNPDVAGPIADWHATTPAGVRDMLQNALSLLDTRQDLEAVATMWTPALGQPVYLIRFAGDQADTTTPDGDQPATQ